MKENQDIIEFKSAENVGLYLEELLDEIKKEEGKKILDKVFNLSVDMLCIIDADKCFHKISKSLKRTLGYSMEKLLSSPVTDLIVDEDRESTFRMLNSLQKEDSSKVFENRYRCKNGTIKWFSWCAVSNKSDGQIYAIARDITSQKKTEETLQTCAGEILKLTTEKDNDLLYTGAMQKTLVSYTNNIANLFSNSFVFQTQKDIVSKDFCWTGQSGDKIFIAVGDSNTSEHAGAVIGILCTNALNRALYDFEITETSLLVDKVRELVFESLKEIENHPGDEVNISLCCINKRTCVLEWSGANNQLLYVHNGIMEEMIGNKHSVICMENTIPFTKHKMFLSKGDIVYIFSNGFVEHGDRGKKIAYKEFKKNLIKISPLSLDIQKENLRKQFEIWKGDCDQTDDALVIAVRL